MGQPGCALCLCEKGRLANFSASVRAMITNTVPEKIIPAEGQPAPALYINSTGRAIGNGTSKFIQTGLISSGQHLFWRAW